jgi:hypothetical protein
MRTYQDNFNLRKGITKTVTDFIKIKKNTIRREVWKDNGEITRTVWLNVIDTSDAQYPSLSCIMGAASFSFPGTFGKVLYRFVKNIIK